MTAKSQKVSAFIERRIGNGDILAGPTANRCFAELVNNLYSN